MQPYTQWTDALSVGNSLIDGQHQELLKFGQLAHELAGNPDTTNDSLHAVLNTIASETMKHFEDEERVMAANNCPTLVEHKQAHTALLEQLAEFLCAGPVNGIDRSWVADFVNKLVVDHVVTMDLPNMQYMKERRTR